ncbi:SpoIIE family protein phosphatase [Thermopolyspora sp. NPDC052614]|uniref:ATP-binding SpoIIE family protein phosphatase n=1 Tax=Thermopolyspora sp. NPDC052614 TaxID=3155682 RepID=UPI00341A120B
MRSSQQGEAIAAMSPTDRQYVVKAETSSGSRLSTPAPVHEQLAFLNEASRRIGTTLDMTQTARELVDLSVPRFCDGAAVSVQDRLVSEGELTYHATDGSIVVRRLAAGVARTRTDDYPVAWPVGEVTVYPAWTPFARCMATARPIMFTEVDEELAADLARARGRPIIAELLTGSSLLIVPLQARGRVLGFASFQRSAGNTPFDEDDVTLGEELAARAALCVDNARLYGRERGTALALQSSLLPSDLYDPLGLEISSRYLPASDLTGVGGDWYDVIPLPGHRVALVVGDVMGHGIRAAATMGQLRTAVRTLATLDLDPAEVLFRLNRMSQDLDATQIATCVYATYDPVTRLCSIARAGHVPPILLRPDGTTTLIDLPPGLPLGIGSDPFQTRELTLPHDAVLALYTDGLVESRDRDIDVGIEALRKLLSVRLRDLEDICDATIAAQRPGDERDDIALMLARVRELTSDEMAGWTFPAQAKVVRQARRNVRATLEQWGLTALADTSELIVSELVTNAVNHARGPIKVRLLRGRSLVCEVGDASFAVPALRDPEEGTDGGRGLHLVNWLAYRWGSRLTPGGKVVWAEQRIP